MRIPIWPALRFDFLVWIALASLLRGTAGSTSPGCCPMNAEWTHPVCGFGVHNESGLWTSSLQVELRVTQVPELCACELICISMDGVPLVYLEDLPCATPPGSSHVQCTLPALGETGLSLHGCDRWAVAALDDGGYGDFCYLTAESVAVLDGMVWSRVTGKWECAVGYLCGPIQAPVQAPIAPPIQAPVVPPIQPPITIPIEAPNLPPLAPFMAPPITPPSDPPIPIANDTFHIIPAPMAPPVANSTATPISEEVALPPTPTMSPAMSTAMRWVVGVSVFSGIWAIIAAGIVLFRKEGRYRWVVTWTRHRCCGSKREERAKRKVEMQSLVQKDGAPDIGDVNEEHSGGSDARESEYLMVEERLPPPRTGTILERFQEERSTPGSSMPSASSNPDPLPMPQVAIETPPPKSTKTSRPIPAPYKRNVAPPRADEPVI